MAKEWLKPGAKTPTKIQKLPEKHIIYSDEEIESWILGEKLKQLSNVCVGIYGHDGTAKSGVALDCRTDKEKDEGKKIIVFDLDGGCAPLVLLYHDNDPNIIIRNPIVRVKDKKGKTSINYELTFEKIKASLDWIDRNLEKLNLKAIVFDGVDKFLKICEYSMREELNKSIEEGVQYIYWKIRNQKYADIIEQLKMIDVDRFFITHLKDVEETVGATKIKKSVPDWQKKTPDMMFQKLKCYREEKMEGDNRVIYLKAKIEKCKTNLALEGKIFTIARIEQPPKGPGKEKWYGLRFNKNNTFSQRE